MSARIVHQDVAAGDALSNSTTETSLTQHVFGPGDLTPGKIYEVVGLMRVTAQNSTDTVAPKLRWGTSATATSNTAIATGTAVDAAVSDVALFRLLIDVQSATRAVASGYLSDADAPGSKLLAQFGSVLTIDQASTYYLDLTGTWSVANAGNSCQSESLVVRELT